jgi:SAM-dependent methyltransferase
MASVDWEQLGTSYDAVAAVYETRFLDELDTKPRDRELLAAFAGAAADPVVEIGCGPGQIGSFVRARGRRVFGLDLSPRMASLATTRLDGALAAHMRALPFPASSLGGLVAFYSVIHVPRGELEAVLHGFRRVLRPGGRLLLSAHEGRGEIEPREFLDMPVPFVATLFELDELVEAAATAGLDVTRAERRPPYASEHATTRLYVEATWRGNVVPHP